MYLRKESIGNLNRSFEKFDSTFQKILYDKKKYLAIIEKFHSDSNREWFSFFVIFFFWISGKISLYLFK